MADVTNEGWIYGLRDIKLTNLAGTVQVDLPAAQELTWTEQVVNAELKGDDKVVAQITFVEAVEASLSAGGISLESYALLTGETVVTSGTTPNRTETITRQAGKSYPYVKVYGRALDDNIGGLHVKFFKGKLSSGLEGNIQGETFYVTSGTLKFIEDDSGNLYDIVKLETDAALPSS